MDNKQADSERLAKAAERLKELREQANTRDLDQWKAEFLNPNEQGEAGLLAAAEVEIDTLRQQLDRAIEGRDHWKRVAIELRAKLGIQQAERESGNETRQLIAKARWLGEQNKSLMALYSDDVIGYMEYADKVSANNKAWEECNARLKELQGV